MRGDSGQCLQLLMGKRSTLYPEGGVSLPAANIKIRTTPGLTHSPASLAGRHLGSLNRRADNKRNHNVRLIGLPDPRCRSGTTVQTDAVIHFPRRNSLAPCLRTTSSITPRICLHPSTPTASIASNHFLSAPTWILDSITSTEI